MNLKWYNDKLMNPRRQPIHNNICVVNLPVVVVVKHSDRIPDELDDNDNPVTFKEGLVMNVLPDQTFQHDGEDVLVIGTATD